MPWTTGSAQATPGVLAAADTRVAGTESVASVLSVAADAIQMSTSVASANAEARARMPSSNESGCSIRNTETTTPMRVPRLFTGASKSKRRARLDIRTASALPFGCRYRCKLGGLGVRACGDAGYRLFGTGEPQ